MLAATNANVIGIAVAVGVVLGAAIVLATLWLLTSRSSRDDWRHR